MIWRGPRRPTDKDGDRCGKKHTHTFSSCFFLRANIQRKFCRKKKHQRWIGKLLYVLECVTSFQHMRWLYLCCQSESACSPVYPMRYRGILEVGLSRSDNHTRLIPCLVFVRFRKISPGCFFSHGKVKLMIVCVRWNMLCLCLMISTGKIWLWKD